MTVLLLILCSNISFFEIADVTQSKSTKIKYYKVFKRNEFKPVIFWKNIDVRISQDLKLFAKISDGRIPVQIISPDEYDLNYTKNKVINFQVIYKITCMTSLNNWTVRYEIYNN